MKSYMEEVHEGLSETLMSMGDDFKIIFLILTWPLWAIPYAIIKKWRR